MNSSVPELEENDLMKHLLGLLPEDEQERLDALSVTDDGTAARLRNAENDLVDAYIRGELVGEQLERFKSHYLTSGRRHRKVLFAESLLRLERERSRVTPLPARTEKVPQVMRAWAWAACLVFTVAALAALIDDLRTHRALSERAGQLGALESRLSQEGAALAAQEVHANALTTQVQNLQGVVSELQQASASAKPLIMRVASLLLAAPTRGAGTPPNLALTADVEQVSVRISLDEAEFSQYRVSLLVRGNTKPLWQSAALAPARGKSGPTLTVTLPAAQLAGGGYLFAVVGADGRPQPVATYPFSVQREN